MIQIRYTPRVPQSTLLVLPSRDRGIGRTDFTLQAFASPLTAISLERIYRPLEYTTSVSGAITARSAGGHSGWSDYGINPQYRLVLGDTSPALPNGSRDTNINGSGGKVAKEVRVELSGDAAVPWNVKLLWSDGGLVHEYVLITNTFDLQAQASCAGCVIPTADAIASRPTRS